MIIMNGRKGHFYSMCTFFVYDINNNTLSPFFDDFACTYRDSVDHPLDIANGFGFD
jgi:hypothetical protein